MTMRCSACGKVNTADAAFCSGCGAKLGAAKPRKPAEEIAVEADDKHRRPSAPAAAPRPRPGRAEADEADDQEGGDVVAGIIPYKNPGALSAYYLGIFCLVPLAGVILIVVYSALGGGPEALAFLGIASPLGLFLGPFALLLGVLGVRRASAHPGARGTGHAIVGTVLGLLTTLLCLAALGYFLAHLDFHQRVLSEWWKVMKNG
jgi:hypothetical protein